MQKYGLNYFVWKHFYFIGIGNYSSGFQVKNYFGFVFWETLLLFFNISGHGNTTLNVPICILLQYIEVLCENYTS